ncbi:MAG: malto-oligosyltrehalose synthase [Burkholderiales bacterium]
MIPRATYRLQLAASFTLEDAARLVPYLARLGVSHAYCSPILRARKGSTHGYDVVDHNAINPELGGQDAFEALVAALRAHGMGLILDIVPNHMGVFGDDNAWWQDVLRNGAMSRYARYFDIEWHPANRDLEGKVLAPVLGDHYGSVLERGELALEDGAVRYHGHRFPLRSGEAPHPGEDLHALLERQAYRLAYWRVAADEVNYRRFFDVNDLAALRQEDEEVFEATHDLVLRLAAEGKVDGLRIDHSDGLYDPAQYFERLQRGYARRGGQGALYVVAEKIAAHHERVPEDWAIAGTTGYRFAAVANGLFVDRAARARLERTWRSFTGVEIDFAEAAWRGRRAVLKSALAAELTMLATELWRLARSEPKTRDYSLNALRDALREVAACMPVYRTYIARAPGAQDRRYLDWAVASAMRRGRAADVTVFGFVRAALLGMEGRSRSLAMRFQQFSAAVAAKGVEDTAFYNWMPLASLNEVGGEPDQFGITVRAFHGASADRAARWPHTMLATSTHDHKRSEDVRCRIDVLSEAPAAWRLALRRWRAMNRALRAKPDGGPAPSRADEYLLYQTLLGTLPESPLDESVLAVWRERMVRYALKAAREAKARTSWISPDEAYERALEDFVRGLLARAQPNPFLDDLRAQAEPIAWFGALNGLSLALIKYASPGVPDLYQGAELVEPTLVDPDNRRPVDFSRRARLLEAFARLDDPAPLAAAARDGRAKLWVIWRLLQLRQRLPALFRDGGYQPLEASGVRREHVVAFARTHASGTLVVVAGRLYLKMLGTPGALPAGDAWGDTAVMLPPGVAALENVLTGERVVDERGALPLAQACARFPVAALLVA